MNLNKVIARALKTHQWERADDGRMYLEKEHAYAVGLYVTRVNKGPWDDGTPNILPVEGLIAMLNHLGNHLAIYTTLSIALYATAITPLSTHTGATFPSASGEITSGSEGYTQAARVPWVTATSVTTAVIHNNASPAVFTIATASTVTVNGIAMYTTATKGDTTGKLISASRFGAARVFSDTDEFDVKYQLGLSST